MINKLIFLFLCALFLSYCSSADESMKFSSTINNALALLYTLEEKLYALNDSQIQNKLEEIISWTDSICSKKIVDSSQYDFDVLINKIDRAYNVGENLSSISDTNKQIILAILISELRFRTFVAVQYNLERSYHQLPPNRKFTNSIIFATTNSSISELKTYLINKQIGILSSLQDGNSKLRCWLAVNRMLDEIDIRSSETGNKVVQRSPYGLIISEGELFNKLNQLADDEKDPNIKKYANEMIGLISSSPAKYKEFMSEIVVEDLSELGEVKSINRKALEYFNLALEATTNNEKINLYSKAIDLDSSFTAALNNRGICFFEIKDDESAINDFCKVLRLDPYKTIVYSYLANCYLRMDKYELALSNYSKTLQYGIFETSIYINRGLCYYKLKNYNSAIEDFTAAIHKDSTLINAYNNRALCYLAIDDGDKAASDYKSLIKLNPLNSTYYYNLGCIYWRKKDWENVVKIWESGLAVNPNDENILKNLPMIKNNLLRK